MSGFTSKARIYQRVAIVYDVAIGGKVYRWDDADSARRFAMVNRCQSELVKMTEAQAKAARVLVLRTTPDAMVRSRVTRKKVRNLPHEVPKEE